MGKIENEDLITIYFSLLLLMMMRMLTRFVADKYSLAMELNFCFSENDIKTSNVCLLEWEQQKKNGRQTVQMPTDRINCLQKTELACSRCVGQNVRSTDDVMDCVYCCVGNIGIVCSLIACMRKNMLD